MGTWLFFIADKAILNQNRYSMEPISFKPIYQERVWGGRKLEQVCGYQLPSKLPYGEIWNISDRENEQSIVCGGPYEGKSIHQLWTEHRDELFGSELVESERFPLLIKILDARKDLSLQVHPPAEIASSLEGEAKTEMWFIAEADPEAKLYVGLKKGVTKESFSAAIRQGSVEQLVHTLKPKTGQSILIHSGRIHAIGAGFLIYEIQQNSDTTFRVYDWNRPGLDGKPRQLHIKESMECIDFEDYEPKMNPSDFTVIAQCPHFVVTRRTYSNGNLYSPANLNRFALLIVVKGALESNNGCLYKKGDFFLFPVGASPIKTIGEVELLETTIPEK